MTRPFGVTILAILALIMGALGICWALTLGGVGFMSAFTGAIFGANGVNSWGSSALVGSFMSLLGAVLTILFGIGALQLRPWAWWLGVAAMAINLVSPVLALFHGQWIAGFLGLIIPGIILVYLMLPNTRAAFHPEKI